MGKDYYQTLGVSKDASKEEIKKAYKKLAKKYHPDVSKDNGSGEKFKEINEAFSVLGNDSKKSRYDQFGSADGQGFGSGDFSGHDFSGGFEDIFDSFFGGGGRRRRRRGPQRGNDLEYQLDIILEDAAFGATKTVVIPRLENCGKCDGSGAKHKDDVKTCDACQGSGSVTRRQRTPFGVFQSSAPCGKCHSTGKMITDFCETCDGEGRVRQSRKVDVKIPKGVRSGTRLRMSCQGEAGESGAPTGDLYIYILVKSHDVFVRDGDDLLVAVPLDFVTAALGGQVTIKTLEGEATIKIPSGTQTETVFRLKGKGMPHLRGGHADLKAKVSVVVPTKLNKKQKELLREYGDVSGKKKTVVEKIKEVFE